MVSKCREEFKPQLNGGKHLIILHIFCILFFKRIFFLSTTYENVDHLHSSPFLSRRGIVPWVSAPPRAPGLSQSEHEGGVRWERHCTEWVGTAADGLRIKMHKKRTNVSPQKYYSNTVRIFFSRKILEIHLHASSSGVIMHNPLLKIPVVMRLPWAARNCIVIPPTEAESSGYLPVQCHF